MDERHVSNNSSTTKRTNFLSLSGSLLKLGKNEKITPIGNSSFEDRRVLTSDPNRSVPYHRILAVQHACSFPTRIRYLIFFRIGNA